MRRNTYLPTRTHANVDNPKQTNVNAQVVCGDLSKSASISIFQCSDVHKHTQSYTYIHKAYYVCYKTYYVCLCVYHKHTATYSNLPKHATVCGDLSNSASILLLHRTLCTNMHNPTHIHTHTYIRTIPQQQQGKEKKQKNKKKNALTYVNKRVHTRTYIYTQTKRSNVSLSASELLALCP